MKLKIRGKFVEIAYNGGEYYAVIKVEDDNKHTIRGRIVYTGSAYDSACVHDYLETGRLAVFKKRDKKRHGTFSIKYVDEGAYAKKLQDGLEKRNALAKTFIPLNSERLVQRIEIVPTKGCQGELEFTFVTTLPNSRDKDGVPVTTCPWYYVNDNTTLEDIQKAFKDRFRYVSSSGTFLPQTKLFYNEEYIGTLADYSVDKMDKSTAAKVQVMTSVILSE